MSFEKLKFELHENKSKFSEQKFNELNDLLFKLEKGHFTEAELEHIAGGAQGDALSSYIIIKALELCKL